MSLPEQVRIAARTGFTHVGLRLLPATPADPDYDMLGDTPAVRATLAALMETGIRVSDVEIVRLSPGFTLDDRLQRFMETAARLGAGQVLVAGNDDNLQRSADNLATLAAAGRPFGLTMNLSQCPDPAAHDRRCAGADRRQRAGGYRHPGGRPSFLARGRIARRPLQPARASSELYAALRWRGAAAGKRAGAHPPGPLSAQRAGGRRFGSARSDVGSAGDAAGLPRGAARRRAGRPAAPPAGAITVHCRAALPALLRIRNPL